VLDASFNDKIIKQTKFNWKGDFMQECTVGNTEEVVGLFFMIFGCFGLALILAGTILYVIAYCKIFKKAGYHWALGLLTLIPFGNFIMPLYLAFAKWPILKQNQNIQQPPSD
jgi:hypothetical protein